MAENYRWQTVNKNMTEVVYDLEDGEQLTVNLREPHWAALLAWLWPGAGHFYQRRFAKGFLYMICVLSLFFLGIFWGSSRVVYASFKKEDFRWQYLCQVGVGVPAFPAIVQAAVTSNGGSPLWVIAERYPDIDPRDFGQPGIPNAIPFQKIPHGEALPANKVSIKDGFMAPPAGRIDLNNNDVLGAWHVELGHFFEIGTIYTLVAGLLNMLAIYDAYVGPAIMSKEQREKMRKKKPEDV